jgi:hypothetical protein
VVPPATVAPATDAPATATVAPVTVTPVTVVPDTVAEAADEVELPGLLVAEELVWRRRMRSSFLGCSLQRSLWTRPSFRTLFGCLWLRDVSDRRVISWWATEARCLESSVKSRGMMCNPS